MFTAVTALVVLTVAQAPKPVTLELRAQPLPQVLQQIGAQQGMQLEAVPALASEVLVIRAKDVDLKTLLDKIAVVTSSEWRQDGEVLRLAPSQTARTRELQEDQARRLAALRKLIQKRLNAEAEAQKRLSQAKPPQKREEGEAEVMMPFNPNSPEDRAINQLLGAINLATLASLESGQRLVFSTNANRMQLPMGAKATAVIQGLVKAHNERVAKMPASQTSAEEEKYMEMMPDFVKGMINRARKPIQNPSKALLVASRQDFGLFGTTQLELRIYDQEGNVALSHSTALGDWEDMMEDITPQGQAKQAAKKQKQTPIEYSADSKALATALQGTMENGFNLKLDPQVKAKLMQPDKIDPLAYMTTDELFALAKLKNKPLVANVPDELMASMTMMVPGAAPTVEEVEQDLIEGESAVLSETEGWLVVKPSNPIRSRANRVDRRALTQLIKAAQEKGLPSLDDVAAYALTSPSPMEDGLGQLYATVFVPGMVQMGLEGFTNWDVVRFYGTLTPVQRQTLGGGGGIPFTGLTPAQQALWSKLAFGATTSIKTGEEKPGEEFLSMMTMFMGSKGGDFRSEPTELMPNGIPPGAILSVSSQVEPMAMPAMERTGMESFLGVLGPSEIAMFKMFSETPDLGAEMAEGMPGLDKLRIGQRTVHNLRLRVTNQAFLSERLYDNRIAKNAPVVTMNTLPPDFQKLVAERQEALKKSPFGQMAGLIGAFGKGTIKP